MLTSLTILLALAAPPASADDALLTTAEKTGFARTGRYDEVDRLCHAYERHFPGRARCTSFGTTPEGRPMWVLVASADGLLDPAANRARARPVVFAQGGIHAGEMDGKDAGFVALRAWLSAGKGGPLARATTVFVPVFNADGHERFGPNHRPNQRGPEAMGWRVTSENLNLNRDYTKADAPEMRALLALLRAWDPIVYLDLHVTDGAKFQHDTSIMVNPSVAPATDPLRGEGAALSDLLQDKLTALGHLPLPFYAEFRVHDDPTSGFARALSLPRYSEAYWAWRNRIGVLVEAHSWKPYGERVRGMVDVLDILLAAAGERGARWLAAAREADAEGARVAGKDVVLAWQEGAGDPKTFRFLGYAWKKVPSEAAGRPVVRYDESKPEAWDVPLWTEVRPEASARAPKAGYVVPLPFVPILRERLAAQGLVVREVKRSRRGLPVETFRADSMSFEPGSFEGRQRLAVTGSWRAATEDVEAGSLFVPVAQPSGPFVVELFEPAAPDSFLAWGFFNAAFERKEYIEDYVIAEAAEAMLRDPAIRAEFEAKLADPAFAKDSRARLDFFYRKHPSYDARYGLYPVYRVDAEP